MRATNKKMWLMSQIHQQILDGNYEICQELSCGDAPKWTFSTEFYGHVPDTYAALEDLDLFTLYPKTFAEMLDKLSKNTEEKEMSLVITKHGDPNMSREFKCRNCGCEFVASVKYYDNTKDDLNTLITVCPECNVYVPAAIPTTYLRGRRAAMKPVDEAAVSFEEQLEQETF